MKHLFIFVLLISINTFGQVQRVVEGQSIIRDNIIANNEFNFFRDWNNVASFKSGIGESVVLFPIIYSTPDAKITLHGLQLNAFVKRQATANTFVSTNVSNFASDYGKDFFTRSVFIDKDDVKKMITYIERDIVPNLKTTYKKQSKEYVYKCKEMFNNDNRMVEINIDELDIEANDIIVTPDELASLTDLITENTNSINKFIVNNKYNNNLFIDGDLTINSNIIVHGTTTTLNTDVYTTEQLIVTNSGDGDAMIVKQINNLFYDKHKLNIKKMINNIKIYQYD